MSDELTKAKILELAEQNRAHMRMQVIRQADALIDAGWRFEIPRSDQAEVWSWYWRRPPRRKGSKGMFFWSTGQAYNHLMRSQGREPEIFV
jgi:hypothetical protein